VAEPGADLPALDEHTIDVATPPAAVWPALLAAVDGAFAGPVASTYARLIRCTHPSSGGPRPLAAGSTIVGFRVATAVPEEELDLVGHHVFSTYRLRFTLDPISDGTRVRAETRAVFPGLHGRLYRTAVVGTGAHVASVRRLLDSVRRRAESGGPPEADAGD
jgi:hypothetical protein